MAFKLATAFVEVGTRLGGLRSGFAAARNMVAGGLRSVANLFTGFSGAIAGISAGALIGTMVKLAAEAQEMGSMFQAVFKEGTEDAKTFAGTIARQLGRSVGDVMEQMAGFQDLFVPLGFARSEAKELSKQMLKLSQDIGSFKNEDPAEVANAFTSALVGNHEAVRRYGVIITEATLSQELMNLGLEKGSKEATAQQKVYARLNLLLKGTTDAHGDAARTANSFTNRMRGLMGVLKDLGGTIGRLFLPVLTSLATKLTELLRDVEPQIERFVDKMASAQRVLLDNWEVTWDLMKNAVSTAATFFEERMQHAFAQAMNPFSKGEVFEPSAVFKLQQKGLNEQIEWFKKKLAAGVQEAFTPPQLPGPGLDRPAIGFPGGRAPGQGGRNSRIDDPIRGMFSIQDANRRVQEAILKSDPQEQMVNLLAAGNRIQEQILNFMQLEAENERPPVIAGAQ